MATSLLNSSRLCSLSSAAIIDTFFISVFSFFIDDKTFMRKLAVTRTVGADVGASVAGAGDGRAVGDAVGLLVGRSRKVDRRKSVGNVVGKVVGLGVGSPASGTLHADGK